MTTKSEGKPDLSDLHVWCAEFDQVRDPIRDNQGYLDTETDVNTGTDIIAFATGVYDPGLLPNEEASTIPNFCQTIRTSEHFRTKASKRLAAIVHDCDSSGSSRKTDAPLTAPQLLEVLTVPRFGSFPEAKRRLVFITNLDESAVWALLRTASHDQLPAIRSFISDHITLKASLETIIHESLETTSTLSTFEMRFHLPFYAVRDSSKAGPFHDIGKLKKAQRLDSVLSTPGLDMGSSLSEYMYPVGASCLLTGQDHHIWTAHIVVDGCHEYVDGGVLEDYEALKGELGPVCDVMDPISGKSIARPSIKPREFFLGLLELRSDEAWKEWHCTVTKILAICRGIRDSYDGSLKRSLTADASQDPKAKTGPTKKHYSIWIHSARKVLDGFRPSLIQCISAWETFAGGDINYFFASGKGWDMRRAHCHQLVAIKRSFDRMAGLLRDLDTFREELNNTTNELGRHLEYENNDAANLQIDAANIQIDAAKDVKILTWVTFLSLPFTLVLAFMSARPEVMPLPETIKTPFVSLFIVEAVVWMVYWLANRQFVPKVKDTVVTYIHNWVSKVRDAIRDEENVKTAVSQA